MSGVKNNVGRGINVALVNGEWLAKWAGSSFSNSSSSLRFTTLADLKQEEKRKYSLYSYWDNVSFWHFSIFVEYCYIQLYTVWKQENVMHFFFVPTNVEFHDGYLSDASGNFPIHIWDDKIAVSFDFAYCRCKILYTKFFCFQWNLFSNFTTTWKEPFIIH